MRQLVVPGARRRALCGDGCARVQRAAEPLVKCKHSILANMPPDTKCIIAQKMVPSSNPLRQILASGERFGPLRRLRGHSEVLPCIEPCLVVCSSERGEPARPDNWSYLRLGRTTQSASGARCGPKTCWRRCPGFALSLRGGVQDGIY